MDSIFVISACCDCIHSTKFWISAIARVYFFICPLRVKEALPSLAIYRCLLRGSQPDLKRRTNDSRVGLDAADMLQKRWWWGLVIQLFTYSWFGASRLPIFLWVVFCMASGSFVFWKGEQQSTVLNICSPRLGPSRGCFERAFGHGHDVCRWGAPTWQQTKMWNGYPNTFSREWFPLMGRYMKLYRLQICNSAGDSKASIPNLCSIHSFCLTVFL